MLLVHITVSLTGTFNEPIAKPMPRDPRHQRDHRRLIDVSPVEMFAAGEIIKLVSKNSVTAGGQKMKKQLHHGQPKNNDLSG